MPPAYVEYVRRGIITSSSQWGVTYTPVPGVIDGRVDIGPI